MKTAPAFELSDLTVLLGLDLGEPTDAGDIEAIDVILERRRAANIPVPQTAERADIGRRCTWSPTLHPEPAPYAGRLRHKSGSTPPSSEPNTKREQQR
jgi:hypothetical protein